jgi:hypothetical protein
MNTFFLSVFFALFYVLPAKAVSNFDLTFNLGPSISQNGNIEELGTPNLSTGIGFNYFILPAHGVGFGYNNESSFDGSKKQPLVNNASISTFDIHYAYRYIKNRFHFVFEPGMGWQTIYDQSNDYYTGYYYYEALTTSFILNYKLFARFILKEWDDSMGNMSGSFFLGAGIIHTFSYADNLYGRDISGNRMSALFQVGLGW